MPAYLHDQQNFSRPVQNPDAEVNGGQVSQVERKCRVRLEKKIYIGRYKRGTSILGNSMDPLFRSARRGKFNDFLLINVALTVSLK